MNGGFERWSVDADQTVELIQTLLEANGGFIQRPGRRSNHRITKDGETKGEA